MMDAKPSRTMTQEMDSLSKTFAALADPTRRAILERLAKGEATVNELAEPFDISLPAISRHLKVLEDAKLITRGREAQWRPAKLDPEGLKEANAWIAEYKKFWEERFDRLDAYMSEVYKAYQDAKRKTNTDRRSLEGKDTGEQP